jgi:hypothetical protein
VICVSKSLLAFGLAVPFVELLLAYRAS